MEILNEMESAEEDVLLDELDWSKIGNDPKNVQNALCMYMYMYVCICVHIYVYTVVLYIKNACTSTETFIIYMHL